MTARPGGGAAVISVVGADGAGKSTLTQLLAERFRAAGMAARRVDRWDIVGDPAYPAAACLRPEALRARSCAARMSSAPRLLFLLWASTLALTDRDGGFTDQILLLDGYWMTMEIRQACNGMLGSMELAVAYLAVSDRPAVLITGAENFGAPLVDRWRYSEGSGTNRGSILGDAGTAVILSRRPGFARLLAIRSMSLPETEEMYRGDEALYPPGCTIGTPMRVGARFAQFAKRQPELFSAAKSRLHEARTVLAVGALADAAVKPGDVTRATHVFSGGAKYVESVLGPVGIDPARGMLDFGRGVGHLGVNDHIAGLSHLLATRAVGPGDIVVMLGNGSGISLSCAVIEIL